MSERYNRILARISSGVSSRFGNATAKQQATVRIEKKCVTGCFRSEASRFDAIDVDQDGHSGNFRRASPQIGIFPIGVRIFWFQEQHAGADLSLNARHNLGELAHACPRARAMRMRQHHKSLAGARAFNFRFVWPVRRNRAHMSGRAFVIGQRSQAKRQRTYPHSCE